MSLDMRVVLSDDVIALERTRSPETMEMYELLQCFAGDVDFVDENGRSCLRVENTPVFRFLSEFSEAIDRSRQEGPPVSIIDFYGEYEIVVERDAHDKMRVSNLATNQTFVSSVSELKSLIARGMDQLRRDLILRLPELSNNRYYISLWQEPQEDGSVTY